jgi:hypothetical protein
LTLLESQGRHNRTSKSKIQNPNLCRGLLQVQVLLWSCSLGRFSNDLSVLVTLTLRLAKRDDASYGFRCYLLHDIFLIALPQHERKSLCPSRDLRSHFHSALSRLGLLIQVFINQLFSVSLLLLVPSFKFSSRTSCSIRPCLVCPQPPQHALSAC